jgi:Zn-finger nucleic acid-binding protein
VNHKVCDSCGTEILKVNPACALAISNGRIELEFDLCHRCQAGLLITLDEILTTNPARLLAA